MIRDFVIPHTLVSMTFSKDQWEFIQACVKQVANDAEKIDSRNVFMDEAKDRIRLMSNQVYQAIHDKLVK